MHKLSPKVYDILKKYVDAGFHLFPVDSKAKTPLIKDMLNQASTDLDQLALWANQFPTCGWGLSLAKSGLYAIDVDHKYGGFEFWCDLIMNYEEPKTLKQITGSGGYHYVFKHDNKFSLKGKMRPGIDIKFNGFIVLSPAINKDGNEYKWLDGFDASRIRALSPTVDKWLVDLISREVEHIPISSRPIEIQDKILIECVELLKEVTLDYSDWVSCGMAIHSVHPDQKGLDFFIDITKGVGYREGDIERAKDKWKGFKLRSDGVRIASLFKIVKDYCGKVPEAALEISRRVFRDTYIEEKLSERNVFKEWYNEKDGKIVCWHPNFIIQDINRMGFYHLDGGMCARLFEMPDKTLDFKTFTPAALETDLKQFHYIYEKLKANGDIEIKRDPASNTWSKSSYKNSIRGFDFAPHGEQKEGYFNLWRGIPCHRSPGSVGNILNFIFEDVCNRDQVLTDFLLDWSAHIMQNPFEKSTIVPVLQGRQGTGKGLFCDGIMAGILKSHYLKIMDSDRILAQFNKNQACKLLTNIDEATWSGSKALESKLKSLTGSPTIEIEEKFGASLTMRNPSRYIITSNSESPVSIEADNRRYLFIEMNPKNAGSATHFRKYWDEVSRPEFSHHFFDYLMSRDISAFNPFFLPHTTSGKGAKIKSEGSVAQFLYDLFFENPRALWSAESVDKETLYLNYLDFIKEAKVYERDSTRHHFSYQLTRMIPQMKELTERVRDGEDRKRMIRLPAQAFSELFCNNLKIGLPKEFNPKQYMSDDEPFGEILSPEDF